MPKRTYQPKKKKRASKHGFLIRTKKRKSVLVSRRRKGRARLSV